MQLIESWKQTQQVKFGANGGAKSKNSAAARGIAYHKRVYKLLRLNFSLMPGGWSLEVEPWYRAQESRSLRSPDSVALRQEGGKIMAALVIEVKMNWKDGRDTKLLNEYLPIVSQVHGVKAKPLLITRNVRGLQHTPFHGLNAIMAALDWQPGDPTPVALVPA